MNGPLSYDELRTAGIQMRATLSVKCLQPGANGRGSKCHGFFAAQINFILGEAVCSVLAVITICCWTPSVSQRLWWACGPNNMSRNAQRLDLCLHERVIDDGLPPAFGHTWFALRIVWQVEETWALGVSGRSYSWFSYSEFPAGWTPAYFLLTPANFANRLYFRPPRYKKNLFLKMKSQCRSRQTMHWLHSSGAA